MYKTTNMISLLVRLKNKDMYRVSRGFSPGTRSAPSVLPPGHYHVILYEITRKYIYSSTALVSDTDT